MVEKFISNSYEETLKFAKEFSKTLNAGDIILLDGDLGAGKTVFTKGIVNYFSNGKINAVSPTFVIMNIYDSNPPIYHFDLYRISDESELSAIGAEEYIFSGSGISIIEWSDRISGYFPQNSIKVKIEKIDETKRKINIER